jgi:hypothetical protein
VLANNHFRGGTADRTASLVHLLLTKLRSWQFAVIGFFEEVAIFAVLPSRAIPISSRHKPLR